jgi:hypothetical protein
LCDEGDTDLLAAYDANGDGMMMGDGGQMSSQSITGYQWYFPSGWSYHDQYVGESNQNIRVSPTSSFIYPGDMVQVGIRVGNGCGYTDWKYNTWQVTACGGWLFSAYPNPANNVLTLNIEEADNIANQKMSNTLQKTDRVKVNTYQIQIWHEVQGLVMQKKVNKGFNQVELSQLSPGTYFLHVIINGEVTRQQLIIQR